MLNEFTQKLNYLSICSDQSFSHSALQLLYNLLTVSNYTGLDLNSTARLVNGDFSAVLDDLYPQLFIRGAGTRDIRVVGNPENCRLASPREDARDVG